jgi:stearoyl-CoA desaturase (delta-9 desaturase)
MNLFYGVLDLPWWGYILTTLIFTHITVMGVTIFLHRTQAHRGLQLHPIVSHVFRFWLWLTTGMDTRNWTAIHRKHHAECENENDPHSPQILGLSTVLWEGAELYRREAKNAETIARYGQGTPEDWLEHNVYRKHTSKGFKIMLAINLILFGVPGIIMWAVQMAWIPFFAAGIINGIGHWWGYRNFECPDASTNVSPWGIIGGGEELHNNHHTYPTSAKFSIKWWEFDIGWLYIRLFSALGLAKVKRIAPTPVIVPGKNSIDADTLRALISNRFQVMTTYSKSVILPLFYQEKKRVSDSEKGLWSRIKSTLISDDALVNESRRQKLENFLAQNDRIQEVYDFRKKLQAIWDKTAASQKELLEALHEWCSQAEATGIYKLQEFVNYLRGYTIKTYGLTS